MRNVVFIALCLVTSLAEAETVRGVIVGISDGDTVTLLNAMKQRHKIRLAGIDAPEARQPFGQRSKQHLSRLIFGKDVEAECGKVDRYRREVCKIRVNGVDANLEQIRAGMAWWYRAYSKEQTADDRRQYESAENEARADQRGLWTDATPIPPWEWRRTRSGNE